MNLLIVDDKEQFAEVLCKQFHEQKIFNCQMFRMNCDQSEGSGNGQSSESDNIFGKTKPRLIAQAIVDTYREDKLLFKNGDCKDKTNLLHIFINIEGEFGGANRQDQKGVEILMWLRCKHRVCNPVILYSFQSNAQLLKSKPEHLIINSEGCYHYQLPLDLKNLKRSFKGVSKLEELKKYLKPAFDIAAFRHQEANWWGVKCLWDVHNVATGGRFNYDYPSGVKSGLSKLNNSVADFIYSIGIERLDDYIKKQKQSLLDNESRLIDKLEKISNAVKESEKDLIEINNWIQRCSEEIDNLKNNFLPYYANTTQEYNDIKQNIEEKEEEISQLENELNKHDLDKKQLQLIELKVGEISIKLDNILTWIREFFFNEKAQINGKVKVLYIDDQSEIGWNQVLQNILYEKTDSINFISLSFNSLDINTDIISRISTLFKMMCDEMHQEPDVVLLDVRLFPWHDDQIADTVSKLSGIQLLKKIRDKFPALPIIITTASNKAWTYSAIMSEGADGYWIKEGIDNMFSVEQTIENYKKLKSLIGNCKNQEYDLLRKIEKAYKNLQVTDVSFWWMKKNWDINTIKIKGKYQELDKVTIADINRVKEIYLDALVQYRQYLSNKYFTPYLIRNKNNDWFYYSSIILHLGKLIELVHGLYSKEYKKYGSYSVVIKHRGDTAGKKLYEGRNRSAHLGKSQLLSFQYFEQYLNDLNKYLKIEMD